MSCKNLSWFACGTLFALVLFPSDRCRADFEDQLLQKFKSQNNQAADKLKQEVQEALGRATSLHGQDPFKLLDLLRKKLVQLQEDAHLPRAEKAPLMQKLTERLDELRDVVAEIRRKEEAAKPKVVVKKSEPGDSDDGPFVPARPGKFGVSPFVPVPINQTLGPITPVVSSDRRFVRIGISGTFSMALPGPIIPIHVPVPTILLGPGRGVTIGPPEGVFRSFRMQPTFESLQLNTTVNVPDGGTVVAGGFSTASEARNEFGPPFLSGIPYLGRAFRNVGYGRESRRVSLGVSARIISMEEEEEIFLGKKARP
jgi:hypothetical protein